MPYKQRVTGSSPVAPTNKAHSSKGSERCLSREEGKRSNPALRVRRALRYICGSDSVVECDLAKVEVAGSNPVFRSRIPPSCMSAGGT